MRRSSRHVGIALAHLALDFGGAGHRIHHARELDQHAVAGDLDDAALMLGDLGVDQFAPMRFSADSVPASSSAHEAAVADHIGGEDGGHSALNGIHRSSSPPRVICSTRQSAG